MKSHLSVYLRASVLDDVSELSKAFFLSKKLHDTWIYPPSDMKKYVLQKNRYLVCLKDSDFIVGTFNISEIVRGSFHSAYLGFSAFEPHQKHGYMANGMQLLLDEAFNNLKLHRLEANIQPKNKSSLALVKKSGFIKEGFSKQYLRVGNSEWKDHERWAIVNPDWSINIS